uniref:Adenylyl-sulfate kinase n=1 Tax=Ulva intestinalis TaxID=3116 RepID=O81351_ULVIN|nr:5'-adenylylsulfate kinase [Ulva intestinalis]
MLRAIAQRARGSALQCAAPGTEWASCVRGSSGFTAYDVGESTNIKWHETMVSRGDKERLLNQRGCVLWFTGLSGSGKSTVACTLEHALNARGKMTALLDGDNVRHGLNSNLTFTAEDRTEHPPHRRSEQALCRRWRPPLRELHLRPIAPTRPVRERCAGDFVECYMKIPIELCEQRDPKGLYKKARAGLMKGFTGIDDPYEEPLEPELTITVREEGSDMNSPEAMAKQIFDYLEAKGFLKGPAVASSGGSCARVARWGGHGRRRGRQRLAW